VRDIRKLERETSKGADDGIQEVVEGYCHAVRAALTDDGYPPLDASGLTLQQRLRAIDHSLERVDKKGVSKALEPAKTDHREGIRANRTPV